jgi:uncharacterized PurR-regulated membrane protein YhhQ (DUF165 family)
MTVTMPGPEGEREQLSLSDAAGRLLDECRMVLPGIQALFGFQLIAVFNSRFDEALTHAEKLLHLGAIVLVVIAIALVMSPAAWHRLLHPRSVTEAFIRRSTRVLLASMPALATSITLDVYIVARLIADSRAVALALAVFAFCTFATLWALIPARMRLS